MEKRLLLAFILSFLILYFWNSLFPSSQTSNRAYNFVESIENKEDTNNIVAVKEDINKRETVPSAILSTLENKKLIVTLSNIGGKIDRIYLKEYDESLPVSDILINKNFVNDEFTVVTSNFETIVYSAKVGNIEILKEYTLSQKEYLINVQIRIKNNEQMSNLDNIKLIGFTFVASRMDNKLKDSRDLGLIDYAMNINETVFRKGGILKYSNVANKFIITQKEDLNKEGLIKWVGVRNKYYCFIVKPLSPVNNIKILRIKNEALQFELMASNPTSMYSFELYNGPQKIDLLKEYNLEEMVKFSNHAIFDALCKFIYFTLNFIHKYVHNWGLCILMLGTIIYAVTFPFTLKSMTAMKKIQALQPKIAQLKEQHKNSPQKLSKEQMELFKEHKVNPLGGCLPMILQMPIFIGFYQVLWRSVMLKGASFLWIKDLSEPDRLFIFPTSFPIIGNEFNLLPFLMGIVMFFQQKFSSRNLAGSDPTQAQQQKMMMIFLPVMMIFIFYKAASGLTLYFTYFYLLTTFTQWKMSKLT